MSSRSLWHFLDWAKPTLKFRRNSFEKKYSEHSLLLGPQQGIMDSGCPKDPEDPSPQVAQAEED